MIGVCAVSDWNEEQTEKMSDEDKKVYGDYESKMNAESDAETMIRYAGIKKDSKRRKMAVHCAQQKIKALKEVAND